MKRKLILKWLRINLISFICSFAIVFILIQVFPNEILNLKNKWVELVKFTSIHPQLPGSLVSMFFTIIIKNIFSILIIFILGLSIQAPLIMMIFGIFYSVLIFTPSITNPNVSIYDWILVIIEVSYLVITATFASFLATEKYGVQPELKIVCRWIIKGFTTFKYFPKSLKSLKSIYSENRNLVLGFISVILILLLLGAIYEVWGY